MKSLNSGHSNQHRRGKCERQHRKYRTARVSYKRALEDLAGEHDHMASCAVACKV
jgi:hypothetical protein